MLSLPVRSTIRFPRVPTRPEYFTAAKEQDWASSLIGTKGDVYMADANSINASVYQMATILTINPISSEVSCCFVLRCDGMRAGTWFKAALKG